MTKVIFTAGLATETNTFSPIPTGMGLYEATFLVRPPEALPDGPKMETAVAWAARVNHSSTITTGITGTSWMLWSAR